MTTHIYRAPTVMLAFWITMMDCSGRKPPGREDKFPPPQSGRKDRYLPLQTPPFPQSRSTDKDPARSLGMFSPPATVATGNRDRMSSFVPRAQEEPVQIPSSATQPINSHPVWRPIRGHQDQQRGYYSPPIPPQAAGSDQGGTPEPGMKGVVQEDYGSGLDPLPGIWEYLGTDIRKVYPVVHLPREIEPVFREMHVWKRLEEDLEKKSVYLFTDTSDRIVLGRGLEGTDWWHQPIIDSTDQGLKDYILENNVQMCWKYAPVSRPIPRMEDRQDRQQQRRSSPPPAGSDQVGRSESFEDLLRMLDLHHFQQRLTSKGYESRDLPIATTEDLEDERVGFTRGEALRIVTPFDPERKPERLEVGLQGVVQQDLKRGLGLERLPWGICKYLGRQMVHLPGKDALLLRVWKMTEWESMYLYTDTSDPIKLERGLQGAWWHQQIIGSSEHGVSRDVMQYKVQMCWKHK